MTKTADNLIYEVASILGKAVPGEALGQVEYDIIDGTIDPVLAEIETIVYIGDRDAVPDELFQTIARITALHAAAKFSNTAVDLPTIEQHEMRLRYLVAETLTYAPAVGEYY